MPASPLIPSYNADRLETGVVHLGFGAFHRAHQSLYFDRLAEETAARAWGIAVVNLRSEDRAAFLTASEAQAYPLRSVAPSGEAKTRVIRVHRQALDWSHDDSKTEAEALLALPSVQLVTITVTEAGYYLDGKHQLDAQHPLIQAEVAQRAASSIFAYLRAALQRRLEAGGAPLTIACCDNIRGNGTMLEQSFLRYLELLDDTPLRAWVTQSVSFPNSMVDRITPKPPGGSLPSLAAESGQRLGPLVIAEDFIQWVLEDRFKGKAPALERVGVTLTQDVEPYEETKIRVLNGGHTALVYRAALSGYQTYDRLFSDPELTAEFDAFEQEEVLPHLPRDLPFDPQAYLATIKARFSNAAIGDTVQRIATDGYAKFPIFIRPTIEACFASGKTPRYAIRSVASWLCFARRVFAGQLDFDYIEPNRARLEPLVTAESLDAFVAHAPLWGDLAQRTANFQDELEKQLALVEQRWPLK